MLGLKTFWNEHLQENRGGGCRKAGPPRKANRPLQISATGEMEAQSLRNWSVINSCKADISTCR